MKDPEKTDTDVHNGVIEYDHDVKEVGVQNGDLDCETTPMKSTQTEIEMQSPQAYAAVRFEEMLIEVINSSTLYVDWCPVLNCDNLYGYKIRYSITDSSSYNEVFVTPGISNYTLTGLKPATEYVICVNAIDDNERVIQQCGLATQKTVEFEDERRNHLGAPNCTVIAGVMLLLIAVVVPVTFLFLRKCGPCSSTTDNKITIIQQDAREDTVTWKYGKGGGQNDQTSKELNVTQPRSHLRVIHY
ncbi:leucine-rich repeat, immunoglobulin-like domain and transmembrane domain-containing protein 2 isoform X1 [Mercenaria mercenaria]|uniref:leucine-rich repeat, immunoglobulin-like domain and transmembrane domain-containing protein 2 isoform X1 n=1 Tax=Mercenaria mercenaria TaxID=6596 RepID=UPI00234F25C5|nr:leucine-rich repeat, immunoglobulin-like domain and transmembrane domain-containing protein 2 isoform X1 [Mercenaria mercenaria]